MLIYTTGTPIYTLLYMFAFNSQIQYDCWLINFNSIYIQNYKKERNFAMENPLTLVVDTGLVTEWESGLYTLIYVSTCPAVLE